MTRSNKSVGSSKRLTVSDSNADNSSKTSSGFSLKNILSIKKILFPLLLKICDVQFVGDKFFLPLFEYIYLVVMCCVPLSHVVLFRYIFPNELSSIFTRISMYLIFHFIGLGFVVIGVGLILLYFWKKDNSENFFSVFIFLLFRLTRTVFLYPLMYFCSLPLMCDYFHGTFKFTQITNTFTERCIDMPYLPLLFTSGIALLIIFCIGVIDSLFLLDIFKSSKFFTATPNGRFSLIMFVVNYFAILFSLIFSYHETLRYVYIVCCLVCYCLLLILLVRYIPFYKKMFVFSISFFLCVVVTLYIILLIFLKYNSYFVFFGIFVGIGLFTFIFILLLFRFSIINFLYKDKLVEIKNNVFIVNSSLDLSILCYHLHKHSIQGLKKRINSIMRNINFKKTKALCTGLIPLTIENDHHFANSIMKHSVGLFKEGMDYEFGLKFYQNRIYELQNLGKCTIKIAKILRKTQKVEEKLKILFQKLFYTFISEEEISLKSFPSLMTDINKHKDYLEKTYDHLVKIFPSSITYRRYGNYLDKFINDSKRSTLFISEANALEDTPSESMKDSHSVVSEFNFQVNYPDHSPPTTKINSLMASEDQVERRRRRERSKSVPNGGGSTVIEVFAKNKNLDRIKKDVDHESGTMSEVGSLKLKGRKLDGSIISSHHNNTKETSSWIRRKVENTNYFSVSALSYGLVFLFILGVGSCLVQFIISLSMNSSFQLGTQMLDTSAAIGVSQARIPLYSTYLVDQHEHGSNVTFLKEQLEMSTTKMIKNSQSLYKVKPSIFNMPIDFISDANGDETVEETLLFDAILLYGGLSKSLLVLDVNNITVDSPEFMSITKNQYALQRRLEEQFHYLMKTEKDRVNVWTYICLSFPIACSLFFFVFLFIHCLLSQNQRKNFKGLFLIPKEESLILYQYFGGNVDADDKKIESSRFSLIEQVTSCALIFVLICVLCCSFFTYTSINSFRIYTFATYEVDQISHFQTRVHEAHYYAHTKLRLLEEGSEDEEEMKRVNEKLNFTKTKVSYFYTCLRYGGEYELSTYFTKEWKVVVPSRDLMNFDIHYKETCTGEEVDEVDQIECLSLHKQMSLFIDSIDGMIKGNNSESIREVYEVVEILDNHDGKGVMQDKVKALRDNVQLLMNEELSNNLFLSIFFISILFPCQIVFYILFLRGSPSKVNSYIMQPKLILLLLSKKLITETEIYNFLLERSKIKEIFKKEKSRRLDKMQRVFKISNYSILTFNKTEKVCFFNESCSKLFDVPFDKIDKNLTDFISFQDELVKIRSWMKKKVKFPYTSNIEIVKREVKLEISRDEDMFVVIAYKLDGGSNDFQKRITDKLICNIIPEQIAKSFDYEDILSNSLNFFEEFKCATVIFCDLANFTKMSVDMKAENLIQLLNQIFSGCDTISKKHNVEKIKTCKKKFYLSKFLPGGDSFFAISGIPTYTPYHAEIALKMAIELHLFAREYNDTKGTDIHFRIGMSSGPVISGIIGKWKFAFDCFGDTVNKAARMESKGIPDKIQVSKETYELLRDVYKFHKRKVNIQGVGIEKVYIYESKRKSMFDKSNDTVEETKSRSNLLEVTKSPSNLVKTEIIENDVNKNQVSEDSEEEKSQNNISNFQFQGKGLNSSLGTEICIKRRLSQ